MRLDDLVRVVTVCQDAANLMSLKSPVKSLTALAAYCNILVNPLIYMLRYDVVRRSLIDWVRNTAAKLRNQQPPAVN